jgi:hypothetical protein
VEWNAEGSSITLHRSLPSSARENRNLYHHQTQQIIGMYGGSLVIDDDTPVKIKLPKNALKEKKLISLEMISNGTSWIYFHFEPHGLVFAKPVELKLSMEILKETKEEDLILYYYNQEIGRWFRETTGVFSNNRTEAIFYLNHFSYYFFGRR